LNNINQYKTQAANSLQTSDYLKAEAQPIEPTLDALLKLLADYAFAKA